MKQPAHLIIIPGVGDDHWVYHLGAWIFARRGFTSHIYVFGWNSADPASYAPRMDTLDKYVRQLAGPVHLLGVSAGGTAAVTALARNEHIHRVATLCSPLSSFRNRVNPLLEVAIADLTAKLADMPEATKHKIHSFHAIFDQVVDVRQSKVPEIANSTVPSALHAVTIFLGLSLLHWPIARFLHKR
jgi:pimeloyl-ACP methyl ester carboxylesterase